MSLIKKTFIESSWVFSLKEDLYVFGGSLLVALCFGYYFDSFNNFIFAYVLLDQCHIYSTYFYTYNSKRFSKEFKKILIGIPLFFFILSFVLIHYFGLQYLSFVLSAYSLIHFYKQQRAWFLIASSKEIKKSNFENIVDKAVIFFSIGGPIYISLVENVGRDGWRVARDLFYLPDYIIPYVFNGWIISIILYFSLQVKQFYLYKSISWGKHIQLLSSLLIWVAFRLEPFEKSKIYGLFLLFFSHSFPYYYPGIKYVRDRISKGEKFYIPFPESKLIPIFLYVLTVGVVCMEQMLRQAFHGLGNPYHIIGIIIHTSVLTHFTLDGIIWKKRFHPEGLEFLRSSK